MQDGHPGTGSGGLQVVAKSLSGTLIVTARGGTGERGEGVANGGGRSVLERGLHARLEVGLRCLIPASRRWPFVLGGQSTPGARQKNSSWMLSGSRNVSIEFSV